MKKILALLVAVIFAACTTVPTAENTTGLTFVHMNDTYRVADVEDGTAGGFSRVVTVIRELQESGRDVRVLHGGDFLYPSLESSLWNGEQMIDAMNFVDAVAPMYVVAGNHEFDRRTPENLMNAVRDSQFDWLGDNYRFETGDASIDSLLRSAFTIQHGDKSIGIFSLTLHPDDGGNERSYVPIDQRYVDIAEQTIGRFEQQGVDAIVGLTHLHMWQDRLIAELRARHPRLVLVAGGHDHEPEFSALDENNAAVVKGASNARVVWAVDLEFDATGMPSVSPRKIVLDESVAVASDYLPLQQKWREKLLAVYPFLEAKLGEAAVPLDAREVTVRSVESNWGNFIVDQMRKAFGRPEADLAFINGGTLRIDDYIADDILFEDIGRTFGFSSYLRHTTVSGAEFRDILEAGYRGIGGTQGYFPQISGFRVCVDRSRREGDRIVSLQLPDGDAWSEIDDNRQYSLVVPDFLYGGGDGYEIPKDREVSRPSSELIYLVLDAVLDAQAKGEKVGAPVSADNPRYFELLESKQPCFE